MKARILLFAGLRERFRFYEMELNVPEGTLAKEVLSILCNNAEEGSKLSKCTLFAINQSYVKPETELQEGDEVALIPPVAGG